MFFVFRSFLKFLGQKGKNLGSLPRMHLGNSAMFVALSEKIDGDLPTLDRYDPGNSK
jgi:ATP phosphoribosyltransferase regulatory subunit HisZ